METLRKYAGVIGLMLIIGLSAFMLGNTSRTIKKQHKTVFHMVEGLTTYRSMPTASCPMETLNPFIFLNHHGPQVYPENNQGLPFGPHPHRGFETVTFIIDGDLKHRDNTGFESIIKTGGVQWMTAGKGIIHAEESSDEFLKKGGNVEIIQLWLNLPQHLKWTEPNYHGIPKDEITHIKMDGGKTTLHLIAGEWEGKKGPHNSLTDVFMSTVDFQKGGKLEIPVPKNRQVFFYVVNGKITVSGNVVEKLTLLEFNQDSDLIVVEANENATILLGHGETIDEPIFSKGPFVMNTKKEVKQAWKDYYDGKFGPFLPE